MYWWIHRLINYTLIEWDVWVYDLVTFILASMQKSELKIAKDDQKTALSIMFKLKYSLAIVETAKRNIDAQLEHAQLEVAWSVILHHLCFGIRHTVVMLLVLSYLRILSYHFILSYLYIKHLPLLILMLKNSVSVLLVYPSYISIKKVI